MLDLGCGRVAWLLVVMGWLAVLPCERPIAWDMLNPNGRVSTRIELNCRQSMQHQKLLWLASNRHDDAQEERGVGFSATAHRL